VGRGLGLRALTLTPRPGGEADMQRLTGCRACCPARCGVSGFSSTAPWQHCGPWVHHSSRRS
jgi:hypothetical protein